MPWDHQDIKFMAIEQRSNDLISSGCTPTELKRDLPTVVPMDGGERLKPCIDDYGNSLAGCYSINLPLFDQLPKFNWDELYHLRDKSSAGQRAAATWPSPSGSHRSPHAAAVEYAGLEVREG